MREDPDKLRRDMNDILRRTRDMAPEIAGARRVVELNSQAVGSRPTLKQVLWWAERGKPAEPPAPDANEVARQKVAADLTERILDINRELMQQPRRKEELERTRDALAQQLWALQGTR